VLFFLFLHNLPQVPSADLLPFGYGPLNASVVFFAFPSFFAETKKPEQAKKPIKSAHAAYINAVTSKASTKGMCPRHRRDQHLTTD
jgi:hypothetical protein